MLSHTSIQNECQWLNTNGSNVNISMLMPRPASAGRGMYRIPVKLSHSNETVALFYDACSNWLLYSSA